MTTKRLPDEWLEDIYESGVADAGEVRELIDEIRALSPVESPGKPHVHGPWITRGRGPECFECGTPQVESPGEKGAEPTCPEVYRGFMDPSASERCTLAPDDHARHVGKDGTIYVGHASSRAAWWTKLAPAPAAAESTRADLAPDYEVIEAAYLASNADGAFRAALDAAFHQGLRAAAPREVGSPRADLAEIERALSEYGSSMHEEGRHRGRDEGSARKRKAVMAAIRSLAAPREVEEGLREIARRECTRGGGCNPIPLGGAAITPDDYCGVCWARRALARLSSPSGEAPERGDGDLQCSACFRRDATVRPTRGTWLCTTCAPRGTGTEAP